jgi:hypothetical protein
MKTEWEASQGVQSDRIKLTKEIITIYRILGGGWFDSGAECTLQEFLKGKYHEIMIDLFGKDILDEVISAVKRLINY